MAGSPPNRPHASHGSLSFPTRLRLRMHNTACRRRIAFGQHSLEKVDDLQFAPLRGHILIRKISPSHAWLCSTAEVEALDATDHQPAPISPTGTAVLPNARP